MTTWFAAVVVGLFAWSNPSEAETRVVRGANAAYYFNVQLDANGSIADSNLIAVAAVTSKAQVIDVPEFGRDVEGAGMQLLMNSSCKAREPLTGTVVEMQGRANAVVWVAIEPDHLIILGVEDLTGKSRQIEPLQGHGGGICCCSLIPCGGGKKCCPCAATC